jgi:micrococcal nuclease
MDTGPTRTVPLRRSRRFLLALCLIALAACGDARNDPDAESAVGSTGRLRVIQVTDGDTFHVLRDGRDVTIRLMGIDTPEVDWYGGDGECFGAEAGRFLRRRLEDERVRLEFDQERLDPYGRTLAYAYHRGTMLNELLVHRGYARVTIYEPNDRYEVRLRGAQLAAREAGAGLWSAC